MFLFMKPGDTKVLVPQRAMFLNFYAFNSTVSLKMPFPPPPAQLFCLITPYCPFGFSGGSVGKESTCNAGDLLHETPCMRPGFDPWIRKVPWGSKWQTTPIFLRGKFRGQRSLAGYNPCCRKSWIGHSDQTTPATNCPNQLKPVFL